MGRIRELDAATVAKIAAGEVIERPASVVKELVENSIDAGARRLQVVCRGGGFDLVQVTDDGCGMTPEEARLAFGRHCTSKLEKLEDLTRISTLGFRGEALPSIAAVAKVEMVTCPAGEELGTRLVLEGGLVVAEERLAVRPGTQVTARRLFSGLPVRRKFLSDSHREGLRIVDVVLKLAVGYPEIAFTLEMDGRLALNTPGNGDLREALVQLYGPRLAREVLPFGSPAAGVWGYLGLPSTARSRRWAQLVYVNRRAVRAPALVQVVESAYGSLLPPGRHPFLAVFLEVDPAQVDVNTHPAKLEVRLAREDLLKSLLAREVTKALRATDLILSLSPAVAARGSLPEVKPDASLVGEPGPSWEVGEASPAASPAFPLAAEAGEATAAADRRPASSLRFLGQLWGSYLLAEGPDGLYVIDQHAAHERVFYEEMRQPQQSQLLFLPVVVELSRREAEAFRILAAAAQEIGFGVEIWEENTVVLRAVPEWARGQEERCFRDLLERLEEPRGEDPTQEVRRAAAACRAAVKAGSPLTEVEARALLERLASCLHPWACPHGRPTALKVGREELERRFGRR